MKSSLRAAGAAPGIWRTWRLGVALLLGLSLAATGVAFSATLPFAQAAQQYETALSIRTEPSSVKLGQQTVLRGVLGVKQGGTRLPNQVLRFFQRNAPSDSWTELNKGQIYRSRSDGSFAFGFVPTRNIQVLVQFRGTASFKPTSAGATVGVSIPVVLNVHENMFSPESFAGSIGTSQARGMDIYLQRSESGIWRNKGQGIVNTSGRYAFAVSMAPSTAASTYRLILANGGRSTSYSNMVRATTGQWVYLDSINSVNHSVYYDQGLANINGINFTHSQITEANTTTYSGEIDYNTLGTCTRITASMGTVSGADPDTRFQFGIQINSVSRFGPTAAMGPYDGPSGVDLQFPKSTTRLGMMIDKIAGQYSNLNIAAFGNSRILCTAGTSL